MAKFSSHTSRLGPSKHSAWLNLQNFVSLLDTSEHAVLPSAIELLFMQFSLNLPVKQAVDIDAAPLVFSFQLSGTGYAHLRHTATRSEFIASNKGDTLISYAPGAHYDMELPEQQDYRNLHIFLAPETLYHLLNGQLDDLPHLLRPVLEGNSKGQPLHTGKQISREINGLLLQISNCHYRGQFRLIHLENLALELIIRRLYEDALQDTTAVASAGSTLRTGDKERLYAARELLTTDLEHTPSLCELARMVGVSSSKLKRGFRQLFGATYTEQVRQARLKQAQELLYENRLSITEIAYQLGYSDTSHFIRDFSRQFGVTPGKFIR